jgi:hypothetical protein
MLSMQESVQKPDECAEINAWGTAIVLEEAARARVKKLIFSSSAAIYGDNPTIPKIESMPAEPKSPYARASMKPNGIAVPSRMKGDCRLFPFATLTSLVHTKILEVNTPRRFRLLLRKQSETSRLRFATLPSLAPRSNTAQSGRAT